MSKSGEFHGWQFVRGKLDIARQGISQGTIAFSGGMPDKVIEDALISPHPPLEGNETSKILRIFKTDDKKKIRRIIGLGLRGEIDGGGRLGVAGHYVVLQEEALHKQLHQIENLTALFLKPDVLPYPARYEQETALAKFSASLTAPDDTLAINAIRLAMDIFSVEGFFEVCNLLMYAHTGEDRPIAFIGVPQRQVPTICLALQLALPIPSRLNLSFVTASYKNWGVYGNDFEQKIVNLRFLVSRNYMDKKYRESALVFVENGATRIQAKDEIPNSYIVELQNAYDANHDIQQMLTVVRDASNIMDDKELIISDSEVKLRPPDDASLLDSLSINRVDWKQGGTLSSDDQIMAFRSYDSDKTDKIQPVDAELVTDAPSEGTPYSPQHTDENKPDHESSSDTDSQDKSRPEYDDSTPQSIHRRDKIINQEVTSEVDSRLSGDRHPLTEKSSDQSLQGMPSPQPERSPSINNQHGTQTYNTSPYQKPPKKVTDTKRRVKDAGIFMRSSSRQAICGLWRNADEVALSTYRDILYGMDFGKPQYLIRVEALERLLTEFIKDTSSDDIARMEQYVAVLCEIPRPDEVDKRHYEKIKEIFLKLFTAIYERCDNEEMRKQIVKLGDRVNKWYENID